jgi:hypothetical protein
VKGISLHWFFVFGAFFTYKYFIQPQTRVLKLLFYLNRACRGGSCLGTVYTHSLIERMLCLLM